MATAVCAVLYLQGWQRTNPAFGQLGFQQAQVQQYNTVRQQANHAAERAAAAAQRGSWRSMSQNRSYAQQRSRGEPQYRHQAGPSPIESAPETPIQAGDRMVVLYARTPVQLGQTTIAEVQAGIRLAAIAREGDWIGIQVQQDGTPVAGWIHVDHVRRLGTE